MNEGGNKGLYFVVGALVVAVLVLGYFFMQSQADEPDLSIEVNEEGLEIDTDE